MGNTIRPAYSVWPKYNQRLRDVVATKRPGDEITLELYRGSKQKTVNVKLGRQPTLPLR